MIPAMILWSYCRIVSKKKQLSVLIIFYLHEGIVLLEGIGEGDFNIEDLIEL